MTPRELEVKRLREVLTGVRKARHWAHAMRGPVARIAQLERLAVRAVAVPLKKLERLNPDAGFEVPEPVTRERVEIATEWAEYFAKLEKQAERRLAAMTRRPSPQPKPIEQKLAARRKAQAVAAKHLVWEEQVQTAAREALSKDPHPRSVPVLEAIARDAAQNNALNRSDLRHRGDTAIADRLQVLAKGEPRL